MADPNFPFRDDHFNEADWDMGEDLFDDEVPALPYRLQEYEPSEIEDPQAALELVQIIQEELNAAGKRDVKIAQQAKEALNYIYEIFPEYNQNLITDEEFPEEIDVAPFEGDSPDERIDWLKNCYRAWSHSQTEQDSEVEIVDSPFGDGYALQHENTDLGYVRDDFLSLENETGGIEIFETKRLAEDAIENKGLKNTTLSEEDKADPKKIEFKFEKKGQLSLFDAIDFINEQNKPQATESKKNLREGFTRKALGILDTVKRWPRIGDNEIDGWTAIEIAIEKGFVAVITDDPVHKYSLVDVENQKNIRIKKAEYDLFNILRSKEPASEIEVSEEKVAKNDLDEILSRLNNTSLEDLKTKEAQTLREIGHILFADQNITNQDAQDIGHIYVMFKEGLLNDRDYTFAYNRILIQYQENETKIDEDPKRAQFTEKALEILDKQKRWPKLGDAPMSGWQAMETACDLGYVATRQSTKQSVEYWLEHEDPETRDIRIKKAEYDYVLMIENEKQQRSGGWELPEDLQRPQNVVQSLLDNPWPKPEDVLLEYQIIYKNSHSEEHRKVLETQISFVEKHLDLAKEQIAAQGYLEDDLANGFHSLPSKFMFKRDLLNQGISRGPSGDVYEIKRDKTPGNPFVLNIYSHIGETTITASQDEDAWTMYDVVQKAIDHAGFVADQEMALDVENEPRPEKTTFRELLEQAAEENERNDRIKDGIVPGWKELSTKTSAPDAENKTYSLDFKEYMQAVHGIDTSRPTIEQKALVRDYIEEWVGMTVQAVSEGKEVPQANIDAVINALDKGLYKPDSDLPEVFQQQGYDNQTEPAASNQSNETIDAQESISVPQPELNGPVYPYEHSLSEYIAIIKNSPESLTPQVELYVSQSDTAHIHDLMDKEEYQQVAEYIHKQAVKNAAASNIVLDDKIYADYPDVKPALPPVWQVTKTEFMNKLNSYKKQTDLESGDFMREVISGDYHKQQVIQALDSGLDVPEEVVSNYPDLDYPSLLRGAA